MARRRNRAHSVFWYLLLVEAALLVLGLLVALAGAAVFDSESVIRFGLVVAAAGLGLGLAHLLTLWPGGSRSAREDPERSEAAEWERMRRRRFARFRRMLRENPPKPRDAT